MTSTTTTTSSWKVAIANATCKDVQLALVFHSTAALPTFADQGTSDVVPAALKLIVEQEERIFEIPSSVDLSTSETEGVTSALISLQLEPVLPLSNGTHPVQAWLYSDAAATEKISAGELSDVNFTECSAVASSVSTSSASAPTSTGTAEPVTSTAGSDGSSTSAATTGFSYLSDAASSLPTSTPQETANEHHKSLESGISAGVLGFAFVCVLVAGFIVHWNIRNKQRRRERTRIEQHRLSRTWMEEV